MSTVQEIKDAITRLPEEDLRHLHEWLVELDNSKWDEQVEQDAANGRLDPLADEAMREFRSDKFTAL